MATVDDHLVRIRLLVARVNPSASFRTPDNSILRRALWDLYVVLEGPLQQEIYEIWKLCNAPARFSQGISRLSAFLEAHPAARQAERSSGPASQPAPASSGAQTSVSSSRENKGSTLPVAPGISRQSPGEEFSPSWSSARTGAPISTFQRGKSLQKELHPPLRSERLPQFRDYSGMCSTVIQFFPLSTCDTPLKHGHTLKDLTQTYLAT